MGLNTKKMKVTAPPLHQLTHLQQGAQHQGAAGKLLLQYVQHPLRALPGERNKKMLSR